MVNTQKLKCAGLFNDIEQPWRSIGRRVDEINPIGSMISEDESRFLYWIANQQFDGVGKVVDLGPLAGGSTHCLASGIRDCNFPGSRKAIIHSFDMWKYYDDWGRFFPTKTIRLHDDILPFFMENLAEFSDMIVPHKGDISTASWMEGPIEILFIDAAKAPGVMERIVGEFYPLLIPGHSIVIHQDFVSAEDPWIHIIQEYLAEYFEVVDSPDGGTVSFRLVRNIPPGILEANFYHRLSVTEGGRLLDRAAERLRGWNRLCVCLAKAHYWALSGNVVGARGILDSVKNDRERDPAIDFDLAMISRILSAMSPDSG